MKRRVISVLCAIVALAGAVLLLFGYKNYSKEQANISSVYAELSEKLLVLEAKKREAERAIADINKTLENTVEVHSTVSFIFRGKSESIYTDIFPIMESKGLKGTIAVSKKTLPGNEGCMTAEQASIMAAAGWKFIPEWSEEDDLNGIYSVDLWLRENNYVNDCIAMISEQYYTSDIENNIALSGYNTLILNTGSGGDSVVVTEPVGSMWKPGAMGYRGNNLNSILTKALDKSGHITFIIGFETQSELYAETKFTSMLSYLASYEGEFEIMSISDAKKYRMDYDARLISYSSHSAAQIAKYQSDIVIIEKQIDELYKEYDIDKNDVK